MRKFRRLSCGLASLFASCIAMMAYAQQANSTLGTQDNYSASHTNTGASKSIHAGFVNTKKCLENSKLGKQEQANFEKMKQQMGSILQEKKLALEEIQTKLDDDDYMDSISEEVARELNRKRKSLREEGLELQSQYMETLQQANMKIIQRLTETISKASTQFAKDPSNPIPFDVIFTDEACTYFTPSLDVTDQVVVKMNAIFDLEQKENASKSR